MVTILPASEGWVYVLIDGIVVATVIATYKLDKLKEILRKRGYSC